MRSVAQITLCFVFLTLSGCGSPSGRIRNPVSGNSTSTLAPTLANTLSATRAPGIPTVPESTIQEPSFQNTVAESTTTAVPTTPLPSLLTTVPEAPTTPEPTVEVTTPQAPATEYSTAGPTLTSETMAQPTVAGSQVHDCPICQDPILDDHHHLNPCRHGFHGRCIGRWVAGSDIYGDRINHCPICRARVVAPVRN